MMTPVDKHKHSPQPDDELRNLLAALHDANAADVIAWGTYYRLGSLAYRLRDTLIPLLAKHLTDDKGRPEVVD